MRDSNSPPLDWQSNALARGANTPGNNNDAKIHRKSIIQSFWESFFHVNKKIICHFYSKELLLRKIVNQ